MGDFLDGNPLVLLIVACEIGFWVLLFAGLVARYLLRARRLSTALLLGVPLVDVVLIAASLADVATGSAPGLTHGLAGLYLGFTIAFGHPTIRWVDQRFAHRYAGGPPPPRGGRARIVREWRDWGRLVLAWGVALTVMLLVATVAGTGVPAPLEWGADPMWSWGARLWPVVLIWFVVGPLWATLVPGRDREPAENRR